MKSFLLLVIICSFQYLIGQAPLLQQLSEKDGLPSNNVYQVIQDQQGYLWICTDQGVCQYNGLQLKTFNSNNGLPSNDIWDVFQDSNQRIWFYTYGPGLHYFKNDSLHQIAHPEIGADVKIKDIAELENGNLNFASRNKVITLDQQDSIRVWFNLDMGLPYTAFTEGKQPQIVNQHFAVSMQPKGNTVLKQSYENQLERWNLPVRINSSSILASNPNQVKIIKQNGTSTSIEIDQKFPVGTKFKRFFNAGQGKWFVYTNKGKFILNKDYQLMEEFDFLNTLSINRVNFDKQENLWIATAGDGVLFYKHKQPIQHYTAKNSSLTSTEICCFDKDKNNRLWVATTSNQLFVVENNSLSKIDLTLPGPTFKFSSIKIDHSDRLFVNDPNKGFIILNIKKLIEERKHNFYKRKKLTIDFITIKHRIDHSINYIDSYTKSFHFNENNRYLLGSSVFTLEVEKDSFEITKRTPDLLEIRKGVEDADGKLWLSSANGLAAFKDSFTDLSSLKKEFPELNTRLFDLQLDTANKLWLATIPYGLHLLKDNNLKAVKQFAGTPVHHFLVENKNQLITAESQGVYCYNTSDFRKQQLLTTGVTGKINQLILVDRFLYVAAANGLFQLSISTNQEQTQQDAPQLKGITVNQQPVPPEELTDLSHYQNNLSFSFEAIEPTAMGEILYVLELDGPYRERLEITKGTADFPRLPPGTYSLDIQAFVNGHTPNSKATKLSFTIDHPWWRKPIPILLMAVLSLGLVYMALRYFLTRKQQAEIKQIEDSKRLAEIELKALRSQMNSHFLFNSLTGIQNLILKQDVKQANYYFTVFSKLIRSVLNASRSKYHTIDQEISLLKMYAEMEQLRFKNAFEIRFQPINSNLLNCLVPSLMLQPILENAILHGQLQQKEDGFIELMIEQKEGKVCCFVKDNGVGIKNATLLKKLKGANHKSTGMAIIKERLEALHNLHEFDVELNTTTLESDNLEFPGTVVQLLFPKIYNLENNAKNQDHTN